ncbi:hypothetical protein MKC48_20290, partial [[Clostridium] innocuum]|nr:hypothetical protein [[Clostridium] innocuum]
SGKITGGAGASGFVVLGNAEITSSYVSGIVEGKTAYGFGKQAVVSDSYAAVYVDGSESGSFNGEGSKLEGCFYDVSVASKEEARAQEYTNAQMISGTLPVKDFQQKSGSYPSLKKEITERYSEEAKKLSALSTLAVSTSTGAEEVAWSAQGNVGVSGNVAIAKVTSSLDQDTSGELVANTSSGTRVLKAASAKLLAAEEPQAGRSVAEKTTSISFNMEANHYYLITKDNDMEGRLPKDHKAAITGGWRRYLWDGAITWDGLEWNTTYYLYDYDLKDSKTVETKTIKTSKGKIGGSIQLTGDMSVGNTLQAELKDTHTEKGVWKWEKAESLTSDSWEVLQEETTSKASNTTSSYELKENDSGKYIRITFTPGDEKYEGTVQTSGKTVVKAPLTSVNLYTNADKTVKAKDTDMVVDKRLYAQVEPSNFNPDVEFTWHHYDADGNENDKEVGRGNSYLLQGKDVGKYIYVKATSRGEGGASGTVISEKYVQAVKAAPTEAPTVAPILAASEDTAIEDTSVTVKMPEEYTKGEGLYQFAYKVSATSDTPKEFPVYARGSNPVTITGLKPQTKYVIYVRIIGENGHENSLFTYEIEKPLYHTVMTKNPHVIGTLEIKATGSGFRYGEQLTAEIQGEDPDQTGKYRWYLVKEDGSRGEAVTNPTTGGNTILLDAPRYVGKRLEVVYEGYLDYSGEISAQSEIIQLAEQEAPSGVLVKNGEPTDTTVKVKLPKLSGELSDEKMNIGYSKLADGVPEEFRPEGQHTGFGSEGEVTVDGLQRNTDYYFFLRFDANEKHDKSEWSQTPFTIKTKKTEFNGAIYFDCGSGIIAPVQGERITARLGKLDSSGTVPNTIEGTWTWYKTEPGKEKAVIKNFYPGEDGYSTYYEIPKDETAGTTYSVEFKFLEDYLVTKENGATADHIEAVSQGSREQKKDKMTQPNGNDIQKVEDMITDSTITFQMDGTAGLVYSFRYSTGNDVEKAETVAYDTYTGTNVTIKDLKRDTEYHIWVKVKGNDTYLDSDWSAAYLTAKTKKTDILGYVEIKGMNAAGQEITAVYNKANYIPVGDDTTGSWQWYREIGSNSFQPITNATKAAYTPTSADIDKKLKAVYTIKDTDSFTGSKEAETEKIKKALVSNPVIENFKQGTDTDKSRPTLSFTLEDAENVWYRIQPRNGTTPPEVPTQIKSEELVKAGWTACTANVVTGIEKDYENKELEPNTDYILYVVKPETSETQVSSIVSVQTTIAQITQIGSIEISYLDDAAVIDYPVVGKTIKATLKDANNNKGTWKWYKSKDVCSNTGGGTVPDVKNEASWEQLASGYSPTINSDTSTLTVNEDMWKHYIRAEFVPNKDEGYSGESIKAMDSKYVRKIYNEKIKIESSTKDGNGDAAAYSGTKITATVENWTGDSLSGRLEMYINEQDGQVFDQKTYNENVMIGTAGSWEKQNTRNVYTYLTVPSNILLYVDTELKAIPTNHKKKSEKIIPYKSGVPISTAQEFLNLVQAKSDTAYESRSADYILTNNIDLTGLTQAFPKTTFTGTLDGDFHSVKGLTTCIFSLMEGTSGDVAEVRNLIVSNAKINNQSQYGMGIVVGQTYQYTRLYRILAVQSSVIGNNCGMLVGTSGKDESDWDVTLRRSNVIEECASASSSLVAKNGASVGGMTGFAPNVYIKNCLSVQSSVSGGTHRGGFIGHGHRLGYDNMENNYYAGNADGAIGGMQGTVQGDANIWNTIRLFKNNYYDSTLIGKVGSTTSEHGIARTTEQLIGDNSEIAVNFKANGGNDSWKFSNGFYPRLQWMIDKNIEPSILYSVTKGAFISVDGSTNDTDMFNGNIYGPIKIPEELQKEGYTYSIPTASSSVLAVSEGGTIVPIGNVDQQGSVKVTYLDSDSGVESSSEFTFTVKKKTKNFNVKLVGNEYIGQALTIESNGITPSEFKWYRRKAGSTKRELISGAKTNKYVLQPEDIGYQINVDVSASGYATMSSGYTKAVTSVKPTGISESEEKRTDNSITVKAQGIDGADYEYAYALSTGNKIIAGHSTEDFTISGLSRNKTYQIYARVAGGSGYEPSEWSDAKPITTAKTETVGTISSNGEINMGKELRISIGDDNLQTGTWKAERIDEKGNAVNFTSALDTNTDYALSYVLTKADVGKNLKFTFQATGDFKNSSSGPISYTTPVILKQAQLAPKEPDGTMKDAHTITIVHKGTDTYDFGYTKTAGKDIKELNNDGNGYGGSEKVDIGNLERNTTYYLYAKVHEKAEYEPSDWSPYTDVTTDRSDIVRKSEITVTGTTTVDQTITFEAKSTNTDTENMKGIWVLERVDDADSANTVLGTIDKNNPNKISYQLKPEDAGYQIRATFNANGDYKGTVQKSSAIIANAGQTMGDETIAISDVEQHSAKLNVTKTSENEAIYEFGYKKSEEGDEKIQSNNITVTWGKIVEISNLSRNTDYDFYIRKAQRIGYDASAWQKVNTDKSVKTKKSPLNGNISVSGDNQKPSVDSTITVSYDMGIYPDGADDTDSGTWQWYLEGKAVSKEQGGTSASFKIPPVDENPTVTVRFIAKEESDFSDHVERSFGKVFKADHRTPKAPLVTANSEDDTAIGSLLHLANSEDTLDDVYYYLQESKIDDLPTLEVAEKVNERADSTVDNTTTENTDHWLKVTGKEMDIRVKANRSYVVYTARLESRTNAVSGINSARPVKSAKEPLARKDYDKIEEADKTVAWKTLQDKTVKYSVDGTAPTVSWKYYVSDKNTAGAVWQNIDAEMKAVDGWREDGSSSDGKYATSRFQIPLKYTGQYLKITMTGIDDYSGTITHITKEPLEGALITGTALIKTKDTTKILDTIQAEYLGEDEKNGTFTWYRQPVTESNVPIGDPQKIENSETKGNISTYSLTPLELDCKVFAIYTAAENTEFVGSVETNGIIVRQKAQQNQPDAPQKVRVNGNSIQFSAPTNYKTDKTVDIPYVQIGYLRYVDDKPVDDEGTTLSTQGDIEKNIHWQSEEAYKKQETWFYGLKRDSDYRLFARFIPTAAYDQSAMSAPSDIIKTGHALFDKEKLMIQTVVKLGKAEETTRKSDIGAQILITYTGEGYDEGEFSLQRSNGEDITLDQALVEIDAATETISYTYTYAKEDVGSYITVEYSAKEDALHYQGSITKTNSEVVTKKVNPDQPEAKYQILERDLDTNLILTEVNDKYEYYLSDKETYVPEGSDYDTLSKNEDGSHEFTNLKRMGEYYLWTRIAETDTYAASIPQKSEKISPTPFIDFGDLMLENETDKVSPPKTESKLIAFPDTLKKGAITIKENLIKTQVDENDPEAQAIEADIKHPVSEFVRGDGSASDLVYEKGSTWGDRNFAVELVFYDKDKNELQRVDGTKETVEVPVETAFMKVVIYRVNAMHETAYTWEAMLEDASDEKITAKLKADITMTTQISIQLPQKIWLTLDEQVMR